MKRGKVSFAMALRCTVARIIALGGRFVENGEGTLQIALGDGSDAETIKRIANAVLTGNPDFSSSRREGSAQADGRAGSAVRRRERGMTDLSPPSKRSCQLGNSSPHRDGNREARIQAAVVAWLREAAPDAIIFAVPNDGHYSKSEASRRRWIGVLAGIPDVAVIDATGRPAFFEVKAAGEYPRPEQRAVIEQLTALGVRCAVVRSLEEAQAVAEQWGLISGRAAA